MTVKNVSAECSIWDLMFAGSNMGSLRSVAARTPIVPTRAGLISIPDRLRFLQTDLTTLELSQAESVLLEELQEILDSLETSDRPNRLGQDALRIRKLVKRVEQILENEATNRAVFVVLRSRQGEIHELLTDPTGFFGIPENEIFNLTTTGIDDFSEAARCYSVGFTVASIMFMLRATEEVLRSYYQLVTRQTAKEKSWGNLLTVLKIPVLNCPTNLIAQLDKLLTKRNEAMHPRVRKPTEWNQDAARQMLADCRTVITLMIEDSRNKSVKAT